MLSSFRRRHASFFTANAQLKLFAGYLLVLYIVFMIGLRIGWLVFLGLMIFVSLFTWYFSLQSLQSITGLPTSKIASASQGYVKLEGRGRVYGESRLIGKLTGLPCLWYRYRIEERESRNKWIIVDCGESTNPFLLDDGSGVCVVDPNGAQIEATHNDSWYYAENRYTEWTLIGNDKICVFGNFSTISHSAVGLNLDDDVKKILSEWKREMPKLRQRFGLKNIAILDDEKWTLVRQAAKQEAESRQNIARAKDDLNFLSSPRDGRLFFISNADQESLAKLYLLLVRVHIIILFGAIGGLAWTVN